MRILMNDNPSMRGKLKATGVSRRPFIGSTFPFICQNMPSIKAPIARKRPFVRFFAFTLQELVTVLVVASILGVLAAPNMISFVTNNRLVTQANDFLAALSLARAEAVRVGTNVGVCASSNATSCGGTWNQGYIIFQDADNSEGWSGGDTVLRVFSAMPTGFTLIHDTVAATTVVVYTREGLLAEVASGDGAGDGAYSLCHVDSGKGRRIDVANVTGRASIEATPLTGC